MYSLIRGILPVLFFLSTSTVWAQEIKYWVLFTDKSPDAYLALSPQARSNRLRQGIQPDEKDRAVSGSYITTLKTQGIVPVHTSRWFNGVTAWLTPAQALELRQLSFVREVRPVGTYRSQPVMITCDPEVENDDPARQLNMLGLPTLHSLGSQGEGVIIAVFDNGFTGADTVQALRHIIQDGRLLAQRDFVSGDMDVFNKCLHCRHGTAVYSLLAAQDPALTGSAPGATYILLRTENDSSETHQEEDNWIAAAEYADSLGAQIFSTSLGYRDFDPGQISYHLNDLDGNTALITRAADLAASRGILVINSAGNDGTNGIVAPADGDSVLAIGAVNACETVANFSSRGPSADGRIKPDLSAMGEKVWYLDPAGNLRQGSGTSFSCPLVSGLAACLWQAWPAASAQDISEALRQRADRYTTPDNLYGYGIPDAMQAYGWLAARFPSPAVIYPNPADGFFVFSIPAGTDLTDARVVVTDLAGREVAPVFVRLNPQQGRVTMPDHLAPGLYAVRLMVDGAVLLAGRVYLTGR
ncbi:MAG: S8 family peptidase [Bacteroidia bacterium]|nr:S8 family peptidase [Bacteroidia bacterium]